MTRARRPSELSMRAEARKLWREMVRSEDKAKDATQRATTAREELRRLRVKAEAKLRVEVPADAMLLDVLELIEVEDGEVWRWLGVRNNHDLPTIRVERTEVSLPRYLALAFGVITEDDFGVLYPKDGDPEDVNPWHRVLRRSDAPVGNRYRYQFDADAPDG